jgi:hypothetical protein
MLERAGDTPVMRALPLLVLLGGCNMASDPFAEREGMWEVTTQLISIEDPQLSEKDLAELRKAGGKAETRQVCMGPRALVGQKVQGGDCVVIRHADTGSRIDREWRCPATAKTPLRFTSFKGTRAPDRYEMRMTIKDRVVGRESMVLVSRETGRRIGDCDPGTGGIG